MAIITQQQVDDYKEDSRNKLDKKTKRRSITRQEVGGLFRILADWFIVIQDQITAIGGTISGFIDDSVISGTKTWSSLKFNTFFNANKLLKTAKIYATNGIAYIDFTELIGKPAPFEVVLSGGAVYTIGSVLNNDLYVCTFDPTNGRITFPYNLMIGQWAYARYTSTGSNESNYVSELLIIVGIYEDIQSHPAWNGSIPAVFYVSVDNKNMGGKKGAYKYIPGFTVTPAQIAINFNE